MCINRRVLHIFGRELFNDYLYMFKQNLVVTKNQNSISIYVSMNVLQYNMVVW